MLALFGLELIAGISLIWCLMPRAQVTAGFFRIQMLLVLGLSVLVFLVVGRADDGQQVLTIATGGFVIDVVHESVRLIALVAFLGSILWRLERRVGGTRCLWIIFALSGTALAIWARDRGVPLWMTELSAFTTAGTLGGAVTGMLLGHWYLTAPTMSITPLSRLTWLLLAGLGARLVVSAIGWTFAGDALHGSLIWTWFALRWLAGILGPLVLCGMTLRILRYRNTQAATGVLFACVILAFIGEMSATLLLAELQRPL